MKGFQSGAPGIGQGVNFGPEERCQESVDTKGLTGRGTRPELRQLQAEVDKLERHMAELVQASKKAGGQMYLMLHQRPATGYVFLRWRMASSGGKRHLPWDAAREIYMGYPEHMRAWYIQITERAVQSNAAHVRLRKDIRTLGRQLQAVQGPVYARRVPG
jgi:predicted secreted protein